MKYDWNGVEHSLESRKKRLECCDHVISTCNQNGLVSTNPLLWTVSTYGFRISQPQQLPIWGDKVLHLLLLKSSMPKLYCGPRKGAKSHRLPLDVTQRWQIEMSSTKRLNDRTSRSFDPETRFPRFASTNLKHFQSENVFIWWTRQRLCHSWSWRHRHPPASGKLINNEAVTSCHSKIRKD